MAYGGVVERAGRFRSVDDPGNDRRAPKEQQERRSFGQVDRDRILYSPEFMRLVNVTQVVGHGERQVFHSRMMHSLKVAQVGRRLAQYLSEDNVGQHHLVRSLGGLDTDVVEAACLAHDIGHPPFGHLAEEVLNELGREDKLEGFEGNDRGCTGDRSSSPPRGTAGR